MALATALLLGTGSAHADALTELVRTVAAAPAPAAASAPECAPRKSRLRKAKPNSQRTRAARRSRKRGPATEAGTPVALQLSAEQRGSGQVDTLDAAGHVAPGGGPTIEPKSGFAPPRSAAR